MTTEIDAHASELLEAMYDAERDGSDQDETIATYLQRAGRDSDYGFTLVDWLVQHGMVKSHHTYRTPRGRITPHGMQAIQQLHADRASPKIRAAILRNAMIAWLDEQEERGTHPASFQDFSDSLESAGGRGSFSEREISGAAEHLERQGLVESPQVAEFPAGWIGPRLTARGRECITDYRGDVAEYLRDHSGASPATLARSVADDIWSA